MTIRSCLVLGFALLACAPATAFDTSARQAILVDFETETIILERDADTPVPPASMSKLMTVYMVFDRLRDGLLALDDMLPVSEKAWRTGGSKMFVEVNTEVSVEDLLRGIIVQSGNDACVVVAEAISGSVRAFADAMNERAREIGLLDSHFINASGLPDPNHLMSARDLARLTRLLIVEFPDFFPYFEEKTFVYNGISQDNRNPLLFRDMGADGMKTGYTKDAGYSLAATAVQNGRRLVLVVTGLESARERAEEAVRIFGWGFRETRNYTLFRAGETIESVDVWLGREDRVPVVLAADLVVTLSRASRKALRAKAMFESPVPAPIAAGARVGVLHIDAPDIRPLEVPLTAAIAVERSALFGRLWSALLYTVFGAPSS